jgi:hypothetical protein
MTPNTPTIKIILKKIRIIRIIIILINMIINLEIILIVRIYVSTYMSLLAETNRESSMKDYIAERHAT